MREHDGVGVHDSVAGLVRLAKTKKAGPSQVRPNLTKFVSARTADRLRGCR